LFWTLVVLPVVGLAAGLYFKNKKGDILMSWTIGKKLGAAFAALVALLITISAISYFGLTKIDRDVELLVRAQKESQEIQSVELLIAEQLYAEKEFLLTGEEHLLEKHEEWGEEGREVLKSLEREFREKGDEVGLAEIMDIEKEYEEYEHTFEEVVELYLAGEVDEAIKLSDEVSDAEAEELDKELEDLLEKENQEVLALSEDVDSTLESSIMEIIILALVAVVLAVALGLYITRNITNVYLPGSKLIIT